jgi:hypothetical protein
VLLGARFTGSKRRTDCTLCFRLYTSLARIATGGHRIAVASQLVAPTAITGVSSLKSITEPKCLVFGEAFGLFAIIGSLGLAGLVFEDFGLVVIIGSFRLADLIFEEDFDLVVVGRHLS